MFSKVVICLAVLVLGACAPKIDYAATYTAFWENLPSETPLPTDTPTQEPTATHTPSPSSPPTKTNTLVPTDTVEPTATLTPTWQPSPYLYWPDADFTQADVWYGGDAWCPQRGENVSCETEYRQYSNGCFVGMSCFDACGKYYGVNTIKYGIGDFYFTGSCRGN